MYLSLNWLKDHLVVPKGMAPEELAAKLTLHTVEVEKIERQSDRFKNIVVGKVLEVGKHPNADRLNLTKVDVGEKEPLSIVCGAPNVAAGQLVPVALVGAELPNGLKIEEREVRGEKSQGMICAPDELGLGDDHSGIMVLEKKARLGLPFAEYLGLEDVIFEVDNKSLANRPDLWGHWGMAREIAVFLGSKTTKEFARLSENRIKADGRENISVKIEAADLCQRYTAVRISGVEIKESPQPIKDRLIAVGQRPINNIVDATNYVMLELGQPLHAFDASLVSGIVVRRARAGETIKTIDGQERKLDESMLLIADDKKALAVAGVMGGESSEINPSTKEIILEAATFDASSIRKTSTKLSLRTEASVRFEKALDPNLCELALARCLEIIKQTCPGAEASGAVADVGNFSLFTGPLEVDLNWLETRLGENLGKKKIVRILEDLGFAVESSSAHVVKVTIPTWRATKDIKIKEDVLEEVARIYGYDNLSLRVPTVAMKAPEANEERQLERKVKNLLSGGAALTETSNYSFLNEDRLKKLGVPSDGCVRLANPISNQHTLLRPNLFANILDNVKTNQAKYDSISLFELGSVFADAVGTINKDSSRGENLPYQEKRLCLLEASDSGRDAYDKVKGKLSYLLAVLNLKEKFEPTESLYPEWARPGSYAKIEANGQDLGFAGIIDEETASDLGLKKETAILEISFSKLFDLVRSAPAKTYAKPNKYPALSRDLAFVVDTKVMYNDVKAELDSFDPLLGEVELFDVYEGENLPRGQKSLAFHLSYFSPDRTLESAEVDELQAKLVEKLEKKFEAKVRDF